MPNSYKRKFAVIIAGGGHQDGSEITEAVSCLIALGQNGAAFEIFSPNYDFGVTNHIDGKPTGEKRNGLVEAARIGRGKVTSHVNLVPDVFDGLVLPGGSGTPVMFRNDKFVTQFIQDFHAAGKPIAAICIAPLIVAEALDKKGVTLTLGSDPKDANMLKEYGAIHENCAVTDFISDREHKIVSTPAYMYPKASASEVFTGISKAIKELVEMS